MTTKFIIYVGLNDKDTKVQELNIDTCLQVTKNLLISSIGYGTVSQAQGIYTMENHNTVITENTLRVEITNTYYYKVKELAEELKRSFNQESILIEEYTISSRFI